MLANMPVFCTDLIQHETFSNCTHQSGPARPAPTRQRQYQAINI